MEKSKSFSEKLYEKMNKFFQNGGMIAVFILAGFGIGASIFGHYGTLIKKNAIDWRWVVFFDVPLYAFCAWALFSAIKMYVDWKKRAYGDSTDITSHYTDKNEKDV